MPHRNIEALTATAAEYHGPTGRFRPGNPGKPMGAGRKPIEQALRAKLAKYDPTTGMTGAETIATEVLALAKSGVEWAVKFVAERTEGKVREAALEAEEVHGPIRLLDFGEVAE